MLWSWRLAGVAGGMVAVVAITMNDSGLLWDSKKKKKKNDWSDLIKILLPSASSTVP